LYFYKVNCPPLKITFLGTGTSSGVPMIACNCEVCTSQDLRDTRLRSSILVQSPTTALVVDTGPDFRYQMLRAQVKKLDAVLFTHSHKDHVAGLDDIRPFNYFQGLPMELYGNDMTLRALKQEFPYAFTEHRYPGVPELNLNSIGNDSFYVGDIPVKPFEVWHLEMPVLGFKFGNFTYITDANRIDPNIQNEIKGGEVLVLNALRKEPHISHFNLSEGVAMARILNHKRTFFTHISHQLGLHVSINEELPQNIKLSHDGLILELEAC